MGQEKDVGGEMTNGNKEPCMCIKISEPTHDASTSNDTMKGDANEKEGKKSFTLTSLEFFTVLHVFLPESAGIRSIPVDSGNSVEWKF